MTRSGVQRQGRQYQGMIKCMKEYAAPLKKNDYTKLMIRIRRSSSTTTSTITATQPAFTTTTFLTSSTPLKTTNPSKFAGMRGPPPNRLVFHALPASSSSKSSSSKEKMNNHEKKMMMKRKIGSDSVTTALNHRFVTWRVEDHNRGKGLNYSGVSATELAGRLSGDFWDDHIDDDDYGEEEEEDADLGLDDPEIFPDLQSLKVSLLEMMDSKIKDLVNSNDERIEVEEEEDDDDHMSFCEVEFTTDELDDDGDEVGWCLVDDY